MKQIKLVFEVENDGQTKRFGYQINKTNGTYTTCEFDGSYEPSKVDEHKAIGNSVEFGKKLARLIRYAIDEK